MRGFFYLIYFFNFFPVEFIKFFQGEDQVFHSDTKLNNSEYIVHGDQDKNYSKATFFFFF